MGFYTNFAERLDKRIEIEHGNIWDYEKYRVSDTVGEEKNHNGLMSD